MNAGPSPVRQGRRAVAGITGSIASITAVVGLSAPKEGVVTRAPAEPRRFVSRSRHEVPHVQYDREVNPEMASAQMAPPHEQAPLPDFAARWPDLPSSQDLGPRKVATISYTPPNDQRADTPDAFR